MHVASWARNVVVVTATEDIAEVEAEDGPVRSSSSVARLGISNIGSNSFSILGDGRRGRRWDLRPREELRLRKLVRWPG